VAGCGATLVKNDTLEEAAIRQGSVPNIGLFDVLDLRAPLALLMSRQADYRVP